MKLVSLERGDERRVAAFVASCPGAHLKQLVEWGEILVYDGTASIRLGVERDGALCASLAAYVRRIPISGASFLSGARGPILDFADRDALALLLDGVRVAAERHGAIHLRVDPDRTDDDGRLRDALLGAGLVHLEGKDWSSITDPRVIMRVDLRPSEDDLLSRMRKTHRQHIRGAAQRGIVVREASSRDELRVFHDLLRHTGTRKGFPVRDLPYFTGLWDRFVATDRGRLVVAERNGAIVGGVVVVVLGTKAWILYSASAPEAGKLYPNEPAWWEALRWGRGRGALSCDLGSSGTEWPPPADSPGSMYLYKRGFRADALRLTGYYDLVFRPRAYRLFRLAEERWLQEALDAVGALRRLGGRS